MKKQKKLGRKLGIVTNPSQLDEQDTFFLFVNEAITRLGVEVHVFDVKDVSDTNFVRTHIMHDPIYFRSRGRLNTKTSIVKLRDFDLIFLKKNPRIDKEYKRLLEKLFAHTIPTVNHPKGIQKMGSKAYLKHFPHITPHTFFANGVRDAVQCIKRMGNCVIKQSDSYGGKGVTHIHFKSNAFHGYEGTKEIPLSEEAVSNIAEKYLRRSRDKTILVVEYFVSAPKRGDKRIVILDGDILGSYLRLPDTQTGMCDGTDNGAKLYDPTKRDHAIVNILRPYLKKNGIQLAALDLLVSKAGVEHLSEINVCNPGFCNLDVLHPELNIAKKVVDMLCVKMA